LIIVDTLAQCMPGGDENGGKDMGLVIAHLKGISKATGAMVLMIHHSGKDASKGARGWSGLRAAVDAEIEVSREGDIRIARLSKLKDDSDGTKFAFELRTVIVGEDEDGDPITSCTIEETEVPVAAKNVSLTPDQSEALRIMSDKMPLSGGGLDRGYLIDELADKRPAPALGGKDNRRAHAARVYSALVKKQIIIQTEDGKLSMADNLPNTS
jgi:hypothetical protein